MSDINELTEEEKLLLDAYTSAEILQHEEERTRARLERMRQSPEDYQYSPEREARIGKPVRLPTTKNIFNTIQFDNRVIQFSIPRLDNTQNHILNTQGCPTP